MATYCSLDDVKLRIGSTEQYEMLTNDNDTLTNSVITHIDNYMRERLALSYNPISLEGSYEVQSYATELVYCYLLNRRQFDGIELKFGQGQHERCENAKRWLEDAAKGKNDIIVDGTIVEKTKSRYVFNINNDNTRVFDDE